MSAARPLPEPTPETEPFWAAAREGRLTVQRCGDCGEHVFYPRLVCPACLSEALEWRTCSGRATVYACTVVERAPAAFADRVPYVVALVELEEGPRMMSWIRTDDPHAVRIGMPLQVEFEPASETIAQPVFVPALEDKES